MDSRRLRVTLAVIAAVAAVYAVASRAAWLFLGRRHQIGDAIIEHLLGHDDVAGLHGTDRSRRGVDDRVVGDALDDRVADLVAAAQE